MAASDSRWPRRRGRLLLVVAVVAVVGTGCGGVREPATVLDELDDGPLACRDEPRTREGAAGCDTAGGGVVATTYASDGDLETAAALLLRDGAAGQLVAGDDWLVLTDDEHLAARVGDELDGVVVDQLEEVTGG